MFKHLRITSQYPVENTQSNYGRTVLHMEKWKQLIKI